MLNREDYARAARLGAMRSQVMRAMQNAVTLTVACHACPGPEGRTITTTIGGGVPAGAELRACHQPDGTHRPQVWYRGRHIR